ncbi:MAG: Hpt domain-containing protein [Sulfurifustis sp.]
MSAHRKVDPSTLGWVKSEIDETLKQARLALEGFVENPADRARLRFCITHLHQVVGTLLMVELDGAAFLAREIEALAEAVMEEKVKAPQPAIETLTRGILVLPDYLARLQYGHSDLPLTHLALLNDLRAARQAPPVAELDLFEPDLSVRPPAVSGDRERLTDADYAALARQLRATYQGALLNWLRNSADTEGLRAIAGVLEELQVRAGVGALEQLFWVARALLEGMIEGGLEATPERKKHLARLDQQIKKIVDGAEKSVLRSSAEAVTRAILYDLSLTPAPTPRIAQIKEAFELDALVGAPAEVPAEADGKPSPDVLRSVAGVLTKEIEQAQDLLAAAFESKHTDAQSLAPLIDLLRKTAGTIEMAGVPVLKQLIDSIIEAFVALGDGHIADAPAAAMPLAQALLMLEGGARDIHRSGSDWKQQAEQTIKSLRALRGGDEDASHGIEVSDAALSEADYQQLLGVVAGEVGVNLARIEEALEGFAAHATQTERLAEIPKQLAQIQGAMQIIGADQAVELAAATREHIESIRRGTLAADRAVLDGLAVCVGTIGAYMDGLKSGRKNIDALVDAALREMQAAVKAEPAAPVAAKVKATAAKEPETVLDRLRTRVDAWLADPDNAQAREAVHDQLSAVFASGSRDPERTEMIVTEMGRLLDLVAEDPDALSAEVRMTLRASCDALAAHGAGASPAAPVPAVAAAPVSPPPAKPAATPAASKPSAAAPAVEFDAEILEIFIEDARDVYQNISREFENWRADPNNQAALLELRRGYHTLKGSGRMVGATEIADLAWAVEHMLNHVRDGKIKAVPEVFEIIEQSQQHLPAMIAQLEGGPAPSANVAGLVARTHALIERRGEARAHATTAAAREPSLPKLDGVLLEIFTNEARGHLGTLRSETAAYRAAGSIGLVTSNLTRAVHTLQGNARSLGIGMLAEACAEMERLLHALQAQHLPLTATHLDLLERFAAATTDLVNTVAAGETAPGVLPERFGEIARRLHVENEKFEEPEHPLGFTSPAPVVSDIEPDEPLIGPRVVDEPPAAPPVRASTPSVISTPPAGSSEAAAAEPPVDQELLEIFREEASDILNNVEAALRAWRAEPDGMGAVLELKRALHTLKGGARMAGAMSMGNVAHHTESLLQQVENRTVPATAALFDLLEETHDTLVTMLNRAANGIAAPPVDALVGRLAAVSGATPTPTPTPTQSAIEARPESSPASPSAPEPVARARERPSEPPSGSDAVSPPAAEISPAAPTEARTATEPARAGDAEPWADRRERPGQIRVNTDLLNNLVNYAGEVSIARSRMEQQIYGFRDNLAELKRHAVRFREQLRELEIQSESQILFRLDRGAEGTSDFDPLEFDRFSRLQQLTRSLTESLHDLTTIQLNMGNFVGEAETVLQQQARLNTELQEGLMRTRMVEFSTQAARLRHIARQTARELGKRAELDIVGGEVQIDRTVLERMIGPFEHMIRNSLDHGIETEAERTRTGKPPVGRITITAQQEGNEIVIRFSDDGAGMNVERIRTKAIERGLLPPDAHVSEDNLLQFVLIPGFSTAVEITHVSGRGVGMDVVHAEVKQLGGSMSVDTRAGEGTTFIIRLPLTLSITQALMVYVGEHQFAVPIASVANIVECTPEQLSKIAVGKNPLLNYNDKLYSFMHLGARLGVASAKELGRKVPVLLARAGTRDVAIQVDALGSTREIVIKALGSQLAEVKGLGGATILGDGRVVLILDVPGLWYAEETLHVEHQPRPTASEPAAQTPARPVVMVVDDSLTVRKITGKHLQKRGFDVMVAKDGVDAVEQLRARTPDLMLVDIEMPRMDGYELTGRVRSESALKHIPIIMITSRAGEKHRNRAFELGVDIYMSKPYQEDELFKNIERLLAQGRSAEAQPA